MSYYLYSPDKNKYYKKDEEFRISGQSEFAYNSLSFAMGDAEYLAIKENTPIMILQDLDIVYPKTPEFGYIDDLDKTNLNEIQKKTLFSLKNGG